MSFDADEVEIARILPPWAAQVRDYRPPPGVRAPPGPLRGGHPKGHGVVRATLSVPELPAALAVGVFAARRDYPCLARFSNVQGGAFVDTRDLRGLAVKLLDDDARHTVQDLLCSSSETLPRMTSQELTPARFLEPMEDLLARDPTHPDAPRLVTNLLDAPYFSITPYAFGRDRACKYAIFPHAENPPAVTLDPGGAHDLAASLAHNLRGGPWRFTLCVQLAEGPTEDLDDVSRRWAVPWRAVATLVIPAQDVTAPAEDPLERRLFTSPAQCHPDHRPLGALARVRLAVYATSRAARGVVDDPFPFRAQRQRVAVVGGGGAGLAAAELLSRRGHAVTLFESAAQCGGHAVSVDVGAHSVDPGFGVFTEHTHPNLLRLCRQLEIPTEPLGSFATARSWRTPDGAVSYTDLADIPFARDVLADVAAFRREELPRLLRDPAWDGVTLGEYLDRRGFSREFVRYFFFGQVVYLFPGHPEDYYRAMPLRPLLRHAFDLSRRGEQQLLRMKGGSSAYVSAVVDALRARGVVVHTRARVVVQARDRGGVTLDDRGAPSRFDHVILAVAPHRALRVLGEHASAAERAVLGAVGHTVNTPVAHLDPTSLPRDPAHHRYHNLVVPTPDAADGPMRLVATKRAPCNRDGETPCLVTHDYARSSTRPPEGPAAVTSFEHVNIDRQTFAARAALGALQGVARTWFAGSWTRGLTWHDDAVASGIVAANGVLTPTEEEPVLHSYATAPDPRVTLRTPLAAFADVRNALPDKEFLAFVDGEGEIVERHTPRSFDRCTRRLAAALTARWGARAGDRVILAFPPGLAFFACFVACLRAGVIPVPVYPPVPGSTPGDLAAFAHVVRDADARFGVCPAPFDDLLPAYLADALPADAADVAALRWCADRGDDLDDLDPDAWRDVAHDAGDIAFLQYTSGSTGAPKGVVISHGNLAHQAQTVCADTLGLTRDSVCVAWLPMYHDFALISGLLVALQLGLRAVFTSPQSFVRRPALWMDLCHRERATATAAPDFAYALLVRRTTPAQRAAWDLSALRVVMSAAEPVRPDTVDAFLKAFRASGLDPRAFCPAYGLAEHTVGVTVRGQRLAHVDRDALVTHRAARPGDFALVGNGTAPTGIDVRVVDPDSRRALAPGEIGEIWVDSPSKALGYWGQPERSAERFEARIEGSDGARAYLRTGDEGFFWQGELFVTGRLTDAVIVRGRNHAAPDLERALGGAHPALRPGGVYALQDPLGEALLVAAELNAVDAAEDLPAIDAALRAALARAHHLAARTVVLLPPRTLPRTTSGKPQRTKARALLADGALPVVYTRTADDDARPPTPDAPTATATAAPDLLQALTRVVSSFARQGLGPDDDLQRHLHLDSLQAVELGMALERVAGRAVSAATLQRCTTLRGLARHLSGAAPSTRLALLAGPPEPVPALLAPPLFLRARDLGALAATLGRARRVYALEPVGERFDEVIDALLEGALERLEGARRCVLVGASFGGVVAHALAAGLTARGVEVPRVVMLDAYHPQGYADDERPPPGRELPYVAALLAASLRVTLPPEAAEDLNVALLHLLRPYRRLVAPDADVAALREDLARAARWMREAEAHPAGATALPATDLTYFQAATRAPENRNAARWSALHRRAEVISAPGDHFAVIRDAAALVEAVVPQLCALDQGVG
jgi:acyl-CoA synthetase (AMP-forming)/AMP-acid ligase II/thioesterase domain-containing protein/phytoene dehydrogenase-like protein/acyl carrier protein